MSHALVENRSGLIVQKQVSQASGTAEREAAIRMVECQSPGSSRWITLGADESYDAASFVDDLMQMPVRPHMAKPAQRTRPESDAAALRLSLVLGRASDKRVAHIGAEKCNSPLLISRNNGLFYLNELTSIYREQSFPYRQARS